MKKLYKNPVVWLVGAAAIATSAGITVLGILNPTMFAETASEPKDERLRTRHYSLQGDLPQMRRTVEEIIPTLRTWGSSWRFTERQPGDSGANVEVVRAEIPVVVFMDDIHIELRQEGGEVLVDVRSNSRISDEGSDFGENRRHLLQILQALDERFLVK
ncbi:MAG: DUF1499 domain-containing protein [Pyrinomonadaceae bacterium]